MNSKKLAKKIINALPESFFSDGYVVRSFDERFELEHSIDDELKRITNRKELAQSIVEKEINNYLSNEN